MVNENANLDRARLLLVGAAVNLVVRNHANCHEFNLLEWARNCRQLAGLKNTKINREYLYILLCQRGFY